jgi:2-methylisocitrate lyase-like PEP mutase family enzyme
MRHTTLLRQYILAPEILVIPGVPDPLCARIARRAGFKAVFVSGYAASATLLGAPDIGLLTMTEMAGWAARIVDAAELPVFADGDNGHGNTSNVRRTMRQFEKAGVAGIFFEDQVSPKRCGHMAGKQVVSAAEMVGKIQAAVDARVDPDLIVMARTDALAIHGIDDAIERMHRYLEAGADMAFIEAPESVDQMRRILSAVSAPQMANMVPGGRTPLLTAAELQALGFACVAHPTALTYIMARAAGELLEELHRSGTTAALQDRMLSFTEFNDLVGLPQYRAREARFEQSGPGALQAL